MKRMQFKNNLLTDSIPTKLLNIKIVSWNVNGLRSIERKNALKWIDSVNFEIICLQETKLSSKEGSLNLFERKYSNITLNNSNKKGYSGTATYSNLKLDKELFCCSVDNASEGRIIEQHYKNLVIFNVYFPNGKSNKSRLKVKLNFYNNFLIYCENLRKEGKAIIICGDFNIAHKDIDLKKSKITSKSGFSDVERECIDKFINKGYLDTFRHIHGDKDDAYTWWSYRSKGREKDEGWRIDYILISKDLEASLIDAYIFDEIKGSDHCPIGIEINLETKLL